MPRYDFQCQECGITFEVTKSMHDNAETLCRDCQGKCSNLITGGAGVLFKGTGFYDTDYKQKKP